MAFVLLTYGIALAGLGVLLNQISPASAKITFIAAMAGGGLSLLWGLISVFAAGTRRTWPILTVIAVLVILLTQLVHSLFEGSANLMPLLVLAAMFVITLAVLLYLFHGERPPGFYDADLAHRQKSPGGTQRS